MKKHKVNCYKCIHFFITWDKKFPRGCRAINFKSQKMPSTVVFESSGKPCLQFKGKDHPR